MLLRECEVRKLHNRNQGRSSKADGQILLEVLLRADAAWPYKAFTRSLI